MNDPNAMIIGGFPLLLLSFVYDSVSDPWHTASLAGLHPSSVIQSSAPSGVQGDIYFLFFFLNEKAMIVHGSIKNSRPKSCPQCPTVYSQGLLLFRRLSPLILSNSTMPTLMGAPLSWPRPLQQLQLLEAESRRRRRHPPLLLYRRLARVEERLRRQLVRETLLSFHDKQLRCIKRVE